MEHEERMKLARVQYQHLRSHCDNIEQKLEEVKLENTQIKPHIKLEGIDKAYEQQRQLFQHKVNDLQAEKALLEQKLSQLTADRDRQPAMAPALVPKGVATTSAQCEVQKQVSSSATASEGAAVPLDLACEEARQTQLASSAAKFLPDGLANTTAANEDDGKIKVGIRVRPARGKLAKADSIVQIKGNSLQASPKHAFVTFGE